MEVVRKFPKQTVYFHTKWIHLGGKQINEFAINTSVLSRTKFIAPLKLLLSRISPYRPTPNELQFVN